MPRNRDRYVRGHASDPGEIARVITCTGGAEKRCGAGGTRSEADYRAVLWRAGIDIARHHHAGSAGHVLRNDGWISRQKTRKMAREETRIKIVTTSGRVADQHPDFLVLVKFCRVLGRRGGPPAKSGCNSQRH